MTATKTLRRYGNYLDSLPVIVADYISNTEQDRSCKEYGVEQLSEAHILAEAEWCLYNAYENEASAAHEYHHMQKKALKNYVERQRAKGIIPKHDFEL